MKTKNLQPDQKIFFLGLNKNGTTTFYRFFQKNGYLCEDSAKWWCYHTKEEFRDREVFTDGYEKKFRNLTPPRFDCWPNIKFLNQTFPNSYYILQTRPMKDWLLSRQLKYAKRFDIEGERSWIPNEEGTLEKIHEDYVLRLYWHQKIKWHMNHLLKNTSNNFMILDISIDNSKIVEKLEGFLNVEFTDKLLVEQNKTTWFEPQHTKWFEDLVIRYLEQRKYEI